MNESVPNSLRTTSRHNLVGTCTMGEAVDDKSNVKGVNGLRIIDASVFRGHVSGNIMSIAYAVAEKSADLVKADDGRFC